MIRHLFSIAALALGTLSANAQTVEFNNGLKAQAMQKTSAIKSVFSKAKVGGIVLRSKNAAPAQKRAGESSVNAFYGEPKGGFWRGMEPEGWYSNPVYYTPAFIDQTWVNYSDGDNLSYTWQIDTISKTKSTDKDYVYQIFGSYPMPTLTVTDGTNTSSYVYTGYDNNDNPTDAFWFSGTDSIRSMGNADPASGAYAYYYKGTGFAANTNFYGTSHKVTGFVEFFDAPTDTVQASSIYMATYPASGSLADALGSNKLTANIDYYDEATKGWYRFTSVTAGASDVVNTGGFDYTVFTFMSSDPILGELPTPIVLPKRPLRVSVTGFDKLASTFNPLMLFSSANGFLGNGYAILDNDSLASFDYKNTEYSACNLHIGFNAAMPVLKLASTDPSFAVDFPTAGGIGVTGVEDGKSYNDITFYTLSSADNITVDAPDWVTGYQWDSSYADYGVQSLFLLADALPAGTAGRRGVVTLNCFGKELKIKLTQGDVTNIPDPTAVRNISVEKKTNDKIYNIAGQQVSKDYKGLVIKNGKKFFNK